MIGYQATGTVYHALEYFSLLLQHLCAYIKCAALVSVITYCFLIRRELARYRNYSYRSIVTATGK